MFDDAYVLHVEDVGLFNDDAELSVPVIMDHRGTGHTCIACVSRCAVWVGGGQGGTGWESLTANALPAQGEAKTWETHQH